MIDGCCQLLLLRSFRLCFWGGSRCWAASCLYGGAPDRSVMMLLSDCDWCFQPFVSEVACWMLSTVCCWSSIGWTVRGTIFGCCQLFCCWISVLVFSSDSLIVGFSIRFCFWGETCQMVSLQWLEPSECFWRGSMVGGADVCFWITAVGTDITACLSQLFGSWVHWWRRVPFWGWCCQLFVTGATSFVCDDVVKTENLDWIFLLDVSLLWGWPVDASILLSTSGNLDLFQIYSPFGY